MTKYVLLAVMALAIAAPSFSYAEDAPAAGKDAKTAKHHMKKVKKHKAKKAKAEKAEAPAAAPAAGK